MLGMPWLNRDKILTCCLALRLLSCFGGCRPDYSVLNTCNSLIKERFQLVENLQSTEVLAACHLYFSKVVAASKKNSTTACARARKCSQRPFDTPTGGIRGDILGHRHNLLLKTYSK